MPPGFNRSQSLNLVNIANFNRILIIDDNRAIHEDFRKILRPESELTNSLDSAAAFCLTRPVVSLMAFRNFEIDSIPR